MIGTAAAATIIDQAPKGIEQILLTVVKGNDAARSLYERFDFRAYGSEPNALKTANGYSDEILMVRFREGAPSP